MQGKLMGTCYYEHLWALLQLQVLYIFLNTVVIDQLQVNESEIILWEKNWEKLTGSGILWAHWLIANIIWPAGGQCGFIFYPFPEVHGNCEN